MISRNLIRKFHKHYRLYSTKYDAIIIGAGHNGLVCASYLAKSGQKVLVLERRHLVGGAAVTEEIIPGFKFSRASYLCSLFRKSIIKDLNLTEHGLELLPRSPSSFTPTKDGRYLMMGADSEFNKNEISKFSMRDAENFDKYEDWLNTFVEKFIDPLLDSAPVDFNEPNSSSFFNTFRSQKESIKVIFEAIKKLGIKNLFPFYELLTAPATKILNRWFESEPLKSTLATDSIIGAMISPSMPGSSYVLLHHVMGDSGPKRGVWSYVRGGMGALSNSIAKAAKSYGAEIQVNAPVKKILVKNHQAIGVVLENGEIIEGKRIISNCDPYTTFINLLDPNEEAILSPQIRKKIKSIDFSSGSFKINLALDKLPNFTVIPNKDNQPGPQHRGTIHFVQEMDEIEIGFQEALSGKPSSRPIIEMTIPSAVDNTLAPEGKHVCQLFVQYAPYKLAKGQSWDDPGRREEFASSCYKVIEEFAPGFTDSIIGADLLSPLDLERIIGLKGGNIFHGAMSMDQLYAIRPIIGYARYKTPIKGMYICGSGTHPGGGVMGAPGRNCANVILNE